MNEALAKVVSNNFSFELEFVVANQKIVSAFHVAKILFLKSFTMIHD